MIDPIAASLAAIGRGSPTAAGLVFVAGVVTSIGPCVAPRYIAIAAIANGSRRPIVPILTFVSGLVAAYLALGFAAGLLGSLWTLSATIYRVLALGLAASGVVTLWRAKPAAAQTHRCHVPAARAVTSGSIGGPFLLGAASAFVISPCCTPIVVAVVATSTAIGKPLLGATLLACFALGHAVPLLFAAAVGPAFTRLVRGASTSQAPAIVAGSLMLALGVYYGVLA